MRFGFSRAAYVLLTSRIWNSYIFWMKKFVPKGLRRMSFLCSPIGTFLRGIGPHGKRMSTESWETIVNGAVTIVEGHLSMVKSCYVQHQEQRQIFFLISSYAPSTGWILRKIHRMPWQTACLTKSCSS